MAGLLVSYVLRDKVREIETAAREAERIAAATRDALEVLGVEADRCLRDLMQLHWQLVDEPPFAELGTRQVVARRLRAALDKLCHVSSKSPDQVAHEFTIAYVTEDLPIGEFETHHPSNVLERTICSPVLARIVEGRMHL
jgi:hypothetical protein